MTKKGYKSPPKEVELPEKPPQAPPPKHRSKVEPPKPWPAPPRTIPKPNPCPVAPKCIHVTDDNSACGKGWVKEDGSPLPCKLDCYDYAAERPPADAANECAHRQVSECCGYEWCGKGHESSLPCSTGCYYYADAHLVARGVVSPRAEMPSPPDHKKTVSCDNCATEQSISISGWFNGPGQIFTHWICPTCNELSMAAISLPTASPQSIPNLKLPPAKLQKCIYRLPFCQPRDWIRNTVPDGEYCHSVGTPLPTNCGPDCEDYRAVQPRQPHACTCSQQQRQPRPFARVGGAIIFLDEFKQFAISSIDNLAAINGLDHDGETRELVSFISGRIGDEPKIAIAIEQARAALDAIQSAIEHWNRAAREPRCSCVKSEQKNQLLTITEQKEIKSYIRWRYGNAPEPDWGNIAMWIVELEMHRPESPIYHKGAVTETERNMRLKSITENLDYKSAKQSIEYRLNMMGFNLSDSSAAVPIQAVWTALEGAMTFSGEADAT